jgi:cob(I)alamin adenosyltransferase
MQPRDFQQIRSSLSDLRAALSGYEKNKKALEDSQPRPPKGMAEAVEQWRQRVNNKLGPFKKFVHELRDHD